MLLYIIVSDYGKAVGVYVVICVGRYGRPAILAF